MKERFVEDLRDFVRLPSRSDAHGGEEGPLQARIAERMQALGARVRTFTPEAVPGFFAHPLCHGPQRRYDDRPTVLGEIGPEDAPALLVLAHSDTVPLFRPEAWTVDPFGAEVREGRIFGLGASDDKWGLASLLALLGAFAEKSLRKRLVFASTIDEENGVGNGTLLLTLAGVRADAALYLDGADRQICIGNLGGSNLSLRPRASREPRVRDEHARRLDERAETLSRERAPLFDRPYFRENMARNRSVGLRESADPQNPSFVLNFYQLPGETRPDLCALLEAAVESALGEARADYALSYREPWFEPAFVDPRTPLVGHLSAAYQDLLGQPPCITTISKQDAFVLTNHARIPTVSFGPGRSQGPGAFHQPDEWVEIDEAWQCCQIARGAIGRWLESETP